MELSLEYRAEVLPPPPSPLVVCYGLGVDSTAVLVGLYARGIRPDLIIFADVGAERTATMAYLATINAWLAERGWPLVTVVRYEPKNFKHFPPYRTLEENLLTNVTLPSIAYGSHTCSAKWKIAPISRYLDTWAPAVAALRRGVKIRKAIGFEDSAHERGRAKRNCDTFAMAADEASKADLWFPLQDWGWNRERCEAEIDAAGLPVPPKSSCYFCTAMKPAEVLDLEDDKLRRIVILEARVARRNLAYAESKGWPAGVGKPITEGLWRKRVKGFRGATPKPGSMTEFIREKQLLPAADIARLIEATPTETLTAETLGASDWQAWIHGLIEASKEK